MPEINEAPQSPAQGEGVPAAAPSPATPAAPEAPAAPVEQKTFEDWARAKHGVEVDKDGWASAIRNGRRIAKVSAAAHVNAARRLLSIPIGKRMSEAEFNTALEKARGIPISIS